MNEFLYYGQNFLKKSWFPPGPSFGTSYLPDPNPNPHIDGLNIDDSTVIGGRPDNLRENGKNSYFGKGVSKVQDFENFSESGL